MIRPDTAKAYGASLRSLADSEEIEEQILSELNGVRALFRAHPDYVKILDSPQIARSELMKILNEDFFGKMHRYTLNFLKLLCEKRMVHCLDECLDEYERLYNKENNIQVVDITTAKPLTDGIVSRLVSKLEEKTGGRIVVKEHVDASCIGGIIIETDTSYIDASIKSGLDNMKQALV